MQRTLVRSFFLGKSSLPWEVEVVGSGGSGMEKRRKRKKGEVGGLYHDNPPMNNSAKYGDKGDKMPLNTSK